MRRTETEPLDEEVYGANPKRPWELKVRNVFTDFSDKCEDSKQGPLGRKSSTLPTELQCSLPTVLLARSIILGPEVIKKLFFMLNSTEHEISSFHKS